MRDSLLLSSKALSGGLGTSVTGPAIGLGADASTTHGVGSPVWYGYDVEVNYPSTPTGTTPSVICTIQDSLDGTTFVDRVVVHDTLDTGDTYPIIKSARVHTRKGASAIRPKYTLANTDNVFGTVVVALTSGGSSRTA
jgi:hypothetical protein